MLRHCLIGSEVVRQTIVLIFKDFKVGRRNEIIEKEATMLPRLQRRSVIAKERDLWLHRYENLKTRNSSRFSRLNFVQYIGVLLEKNANLYFCSTTFRRY